MSTSREVFTTTAEDVSEVVMVLLRTVIQCVATRSKVDKNAPAMVTNMVSMFRLMTPSHFSQYIQVRSAEVEVGYWKYMVGVRRHARPVSSVSFLI